MSLLCLCAFVTLNKILLTYLLRNLIVTRRLHSMQSGKQEAQLSQRDRAAACLNYGKNISAKSVHLGYFLKSPVATVKWFSAKNRFVRSWWLERGAGFLASTFLIRTWLIISGSSDCDGKKSADKEVSLHVIDWWTLSYATTCVVWQRSYHSAGATAPQFSLQCST